MDRIVGGLFATSSLEGVRHRFDPLLTLTFPSTVTGSWETCGAWVWPAS